MALCRTGPVGAATDFTVRATVSGVTPGAPGRRLIPLGGDDRLELGTQQQRVVADHVEELLLDIGVVSGVGELRRTHDLCLTTVRR